MKIKKYQNPAGVLPAAKYLIPIVGTYHSIKDAVEEPSWKNIGLAGLSALGDVGTILGVGELAKYGIGAIKAGKTLKMMPAAYKAVENTSNAARTAATNYKNAKQATNAVSLMNDLENPMFTITKMARKENAAKYAWEGAEAASKEAYTNWDNLQKLYNTQKHNVSKDNILAGVAGYVGTNSAKAGIRKNGGIITKELDILKKYQQGGSIKYDPTESNVEIPEIQGYKRQFSNFWYRGDDTKKDENIPIQEELIQKTVEETPTIPIQSEWSDIKSIIKEHEGFISHAKKSFNEPNPTVGYGFYNFLPDGRKITDGMVLTEQEADKQLDIAINQLRKNIASAISNYNMNISDNQLNVLIDLGYHGGAGLVSKLLREANGDINKIPTLLSRYATTAKYGDTSIVNGLRKRAQRRVEGWNKG